MDKWLRSAFSCMNSFCSHRKVSLKKVHNGRITIDSNGDPAVKAKRTYLNVQRKFLKPFLLHNPFLFAVGAHADYFPNNYRFANKLLITLLPLAPLSYELAV